MRTPSVQPFVDALYDAPKRLSKLAAEGGKIVGYFCTYTPVEILHACGFLPIRIIGGAGRVEDAYSLVPDFICPFMKRALERALAGEYDYLTGLVQGYSCDVTCGMMSIWENNLPIHFSYQVAIPYNDTTSSRGFFREELQSLIKKLAVYGGNFCESTLADSVETYNRIRGITARLYQLKNKGKLGLNSGDLWVVNQAGAVTPPKDYLKMLEALTSLATLENSLPTSGIPLIISGSLVESEAVLDFVEKAGGRIVYDDICNGSRPQNPPRGKGNHPLDQVIDRIITRNPCPSRSTAEKRYQLLAEKIEDCRANGILFLVQKFCTPHLADVPFLVETLKKNDIPSIMIEMDESWQIDGQFRTRVEGFLEML